MDLVDSFRSINQIQHENLTRIFGENIFFTNYARTGLFLLLKSLNKGKKNLRVGLQAFTCHTVFQSVKHANCDIVFLDINNDFTVDIRSLKENIQRIDVLIVTHTFGIPAELDEIKKMASHLIIIEDCAHSLFSKYHEKLTGTFCDVSFFSFGYGKYPSIGPGGMVVFNNTKLLKKFYDEYRKLPSPTKNDEIKNVFKNFIYSVSFNSYLYGMITYPIGKKLDSKLDFIGKSLQENELCYNTNINIFNKKIRAFSVIEKKQRMNGLFVKNQLSDFYDLARIRPGNNFYIFPLRHKNRDLITSKLFDKGFESGKHFAKAVEWAIGFGYEMGSCPNTEVIVNEIFTIPVHYNLCKNQLNEIIEVVKDNS
ncbi:DegT/DnrJ/EryC1/StrS family aminotransferase [Desulfotignum balticum]|uniref:DegT/DnrJ/EryC1/StrS family aminotransferase n=1 Tax=Desulfotignum balticum TaxID=115781 RepID=UPI00146E4652|nr:DegT/DnrJ/EryC1/StrS family aminotransferase [Desulfotignum balticum]